MRKIASIALAAIIASAGAASTASAALSDRDGTVWRPGGDVQLVARGGDRGRDRGARRERKGDVIWRIRDKRHHRPFFLFRHGRGGECFVRKMQVRDVDGNLAVRNIRICE